jgi:hypothetical protein
VVPPFQAEAGKEGGINALLLDLGKDEPVKIIIQVHYRCTILQIIISMVRNFVSQSQPALRYLRL